jgi:hypothetical protein
MWSNISIVEFPLPLQTMSELEDIFKQKVLQTDTHVVLYNKIRVLDLKNKLKELSLPTTGSKMALFMKLSNYYSPQAQYEDVEPMTDQDEYSSDIRRLLGEDVVFLDETWLPCEGSTLVELKEELKIRGINMSGKKSELIAALKKLKKQYCMYTGF